MVRTVMIYKMGDEYNGLNSLFTSILSFLSLTELGVGSALVYSMYKPIVHDEKNVICALLNLYKKVYRIIGCVILVIGFALLPFLKYLIKGESPDDINIYILYLIYIFNTVISYELFAYKQSLLMAYQRNDIISKRSIVLQTLLYVLQIGSIMITENYYVYIIWLPVITVLTNLLNSFIVDKMYPDYKANGTVSKEDEKSILKNVIALFGTKANSIVMHSADNIVISSFLGLVMVGKYGNYYYILNAIIGAMTIIYDSITAGLGNSIETETVEKNFRDFNVLSFLNFWIVAFCSTCLLCLYQPFMKIWVHEEKMLSLGVVILLVVYFYVYQIRKIVLTYKDAAGIWWQDRFRPYIMMVVNIVGNLILVHVIGIYGVILSTVISMLISLPIENDTVFKYLFNCSSKDYYFSLVKYLLVTLISCAGCYFICSFINDGIIGIMLKLIVCVVVSNSVILLLSFKNKFFMEAKRLIISKIKKR